MRLIDADKLIARFKQLKGPDILVNIFISDVIKVIKQMPTAYDIDKVFKELEKAKTINVDVGFGTIYETIQKDVALEIVKRGCADVKVLRKEGEKNDVD